MKFCVSTSVGTRTNWSTFEPDPGYTEDAGTGKSKIESRSNRHLTQSRLQVTGCTVERYCLLHVVLQGPRSFSCRLNFLHDIRLRSYGASNLPNFRILAYFPISNTPEREREREIYTYTYWRGPTPRRRVVLEWLYLVARRNNFVAGKCAPPSALLV